MIKVKSKRHIVEAKHKDWFENWTLLKIVYREVFYINKPKNGYKLCWVLID